ncbi:MAG TPA: hypothetical protein VLJ37_06510 [bacterium]|nr:hypothetical protein [bacterium]
MAPFAVPPTATDIASIQSMLSVSIPGLGREMMEGDSRIWKPTADSLVGAAESRIIFPVTGGPGYLYRRPADPTGLFHLILRPDRSGFPNFEIPNDEAPSARMIALHLLEKSTGLAVTHHFVAVGFIASVTCRETEFFRLPSDLNDPVFRLLAMMTGASNVFDAPEEKTLRDRLRGLKRDVENRILGFIVEKMGLD